MDHGITPEAFWDLSIPEIYDLVNSAARVKEENLKQEILLRFTEADAISSRIAFIFGGKKRKAENILQPQDAFPKLFATEATRIKEAAEKRALEQHKAQMELFATRWNAKRKGLKNGNSSYNL